MAGTAQTTRFMMATATLMLGQMANIYDLQPATNSIGLVKNFTLSTEPTFADLTQGSKNSLVFSTLTGNPVKATAEVFEFTAQNLGYALGLDGSTITTQTHAPYHVVAPTAGGETAVIFNTVSGLNVGDTLMFVDITKDDRAIVRKITAIDNGTNTVTFNHQIVGQWQTTDNIIEVNTLPLGTTNNFPFLAAKASGQLPDGTPCVIQLPKVRIVKGFQMAWNSEQFQNMPYELEIFELIPSDTFYADFPNRKGTISIA